MDIINTKIEDILKFPFKEKDWFSTFGIYTIISLFSGILVFFSFLFLFFGGAFIFEDITIGIFISIPIFILAIIFFIITLYLQGYILEMISYVKEGKAEKPKHDNFAIKLKKGFDRLLLGIGPVIISIIILSLSIAIIFWGANIIETTPTLGIILIIAGIFKTLFSILITIAVSTMIIPSMLYIYLETNSVIKGYNLKNIWIIVRNMWKSFLIVYAFSFVLAIIVSTLGQMPCIGSFILIIGTAYTTFVVAFLTGRIFVEIDKLKLLKS